jgi:hypothetical protein
MEAQVVDVSLSRGSPFDLRTQGLEKAKAAWRAAQPYG